MTGALLARARVIIAVEERALLTTATADEALTGRLWNGAIQNYWNEIAGSRRAAGPRSTRTGMPPESVGTLSLSVENYSGTASL
jgi:hypothetical protein